MDSQNGSNLRQALLTSSLGAMIRGPAADPADTAAGSGAQGALNLLGSRAAPTPHDLLAVAQAQTFPLALDDDQDTLTLLPNALSDSDLEADDDAEDDSYLASEFLNAQAMDAHPEHAEYPEKTSQFSIFADACVVMADGDEEEGGGGGGEPRLVARDAAAQAYEHRLDAEQQGREVANIIKRREVAAAAEHEGLLARHKLAVVTPQERFAAYKAAMARPAAAEEEDSVAVQAPKRQKVDEGGMAARPAAPERPRDTRLAARFAGRYALPPETGEYVAARTAAGTTLFFPLRAPPEPSASASLPSALGRMSMAQANRVVGEIEQEIATRESLLDHAHDSLAKLTLQPADTRLWAEKYRARAYVDLVSSERTNRAVMEWLNAWDACVFRRGAGADTQDRWKRPLRRILLLSGPPGLGKTTLAHVAARQKGYDVVEINASDERTAAKVRDRVLGVTQTQGVAMRGRPQLLVIDEIDGASGAVSAQGDFVSMLVKLATATSDAGEGEGQGQAKDGRPKGRKKPQAQLLRPIICICNNVYAPVLRPLRQIAQCYHVQGPTAARLAQRLQDVCALEQLPCDPWVLADLARSTECDVRASLNALQLMANRPAPAAGATAAAAAAAAASALGTAGVGGKDVQRSLFALWAQIFTRADAPGQPRQQTAAEYARALVAAVRVSGEHERLLQGCWENYLLMDFRDLTHTRVSDLCTQWLCFADLMDAAGRRNPQQAHGLHSYLEYPLLAVHLTCSSPLGLARGAFVYPAADYAAHQARTARVALAQSLLAGCAHVRMRSSLTASTVCSEFADLFLQVLSPAVSTANRHLLRGRELEQAERLVDVMAAWGLRLVQAKDAEGQYVYRVEPPVDRLAGFVGRKSARRVMPLRYAVRQMLAQEMERRRVRSAADRGEDQAGVGGMKDGNAAEAAKREYLGRLFADPLAAVGCPSGELPDAGAAFVTKDFFGRPVVKKQQSKTSPATSAQTMQKQQQQPKAWFHFFEGFSNAVRKPTRMSELL
ncbi:Chromosome transmission fidelity protein 18 [Coemansia erecta]|uniref:Chromosome transmission fidelity protein 18 n=1 Tax=Coemansia erecta TaxID=147472 RepID=A0A9W8CP31_9FUNG|nr:Chromosome transmission fidelity protein 18 [Coemansia erecta]